MNASLSAALLIVSDLPIAVGFYEGLGFRKEQGGGTVAIMSSGAGSSAIALMARSAAASITGVEPSAPPTMPAAILVHQCRDRQEVDAWLAAAKKGGGRTIKASAENQWGGYQCAFADPDGHVWSVGFNLALFRK